MARVLHEVGTLPIQSSSIHVAKPRWCHECCMPCDACICTTCMHILGFMHVMHVIDIGHACMLWRWCLPCMHIAMCALCAAHACMFKSCMMHGLCTVGYVGHNKTCMYTYASTPYHACVSCMLMFSCLARDSLATRRTQHHCLSGLASTSLPKWALHACMHIN